MNTRKYQWLFYLITATIVATIGVQFFWNYKNYEENKQRVTNEIQLSLDNAVEEYYASLAKSNYLTIVEAKDLENDSIFLNKKITLKSTKKPNFNIKSLKISTSDTLSKLQIDSMFTSLTNIVINNNFKDSAIGITQFTDSKSGYTLKKNGIKKDIKYFKGKKAADSLKIFENLKPIFISFIDEKIEYNKLDSLIENQLNKKGISIKTSFHHLKNDTLFHQTKDTVLDANIYSVSSKSTYVKENEGFELLYNNPNLEALKRSSGGIFLSLLLSLLIVSCLFYLLKIINQQKDLAAIKNDLISNITHEFKTPIATVSTAIEAIENFNVLDDKEKTKKYLALSTIQLKKLHQMVEKLLETATLDSESLLLKKEETDLVFLIDKLVVKHQLLAQNKLLQFSANVKFLFVNVDIFHFENAISNLIDNAIKYGGDKIEISINSVLNSTEILVTDNGTGIEKNQQEKIFDKFYRVPKGNTHDVKGFGIGLYYCKKIIEKHQGTITLLSNSKNTIFKINLPNE